MEKLENLILRAVEVAHWRDGDIDTEDGTFATTETDSMIRLEEAIQDFTGLEAAELMQLFNTEAKIKEVLCKVK